jgi:molybdopterin/thiamine biosynthesis adenylyltransferase
MSTKPELSITAADLVDDRFDRFRLIGWWNQDRLAAARVLVVGAGALGNEIVKNLALLGVGQVVIVDRDRIELSNLSRSVLFREHDLGKFKSQVAADFARVVYPGIRARGVVADVLSDVGAGLFRWADVVIGGLDNREARLHINRICWRIGKPWIDGAIEQIQGVARVFVPDRSQQSPCYECTMSKRDWDLLDQRRTCALLTRSQMLEGKTPTTPTISSIIAGVQTQEAIKLLHDLPTIAGKGYTFSGLTGESFLVDYQRKPACTSHDTLADIRSLPLSARRDSAAELLDQAREILGGEPTIELHRDIVESFHCDHCKITQAVMRPLSSLRAASAVCSCGATAPRRATLFHSLDRSSPHLRRPLAELGVPGMDILTARVEDRSIGIELSDDADECLGDLKPEGLQWL